MKIIVPVIILIFLATLGCHKKPQDLRHQLIGSWQRVVTTDEFTFVYTETYRPDGTGIFSAVGKTSNKQVNAVATGTWGLEGRIITCTILESSRPDYLDDPLGSTATGVIQFIDKDDLIVTGLKGKSSSKYKRLK